MRKALGSARTRFIPAVFFILCICCVGSASAPAQSNSSQLLKQIVDEYWQEQLDDSVYLRIKFGLPITKLPDPTYAEAKRNADFCNAILKKLNGVKASEISHEEFLSLEILRWECSQAEALLPFFWLSSPITPYASTLSIVRQAFSGYQFTNGDDSENYIELLKKVGPYANQLLITVQGQGERGIRIPKEELKLVVPFLSSFVQDGEKSPFFVRAERLENPDSNFKQEMIRIINEEINPAFRKLIDLLNGEYKNQAPDAVGLAQYPQGKEFYRALVRLYTTMDVTPEQVHETGQEAVRRLQQRMKALREQLKFQGTQAEFHEMLKKDPRFIPKTADEIGEKLLSHDKRIAPKISQYFSLKPKAPHTVKRLDPALEGAMTFGYYQVPTKRDPSGIYYYNGSNLSERPLFNSASLVFHELVPGHHFQINLQSENESLPAFRREGGHNAFVEGWAEYSSALAEEMGMYQDPYELYGRLAAEMFLTVRLVVDTGMNYYGWSREKAMEFMKANLLESETQIRTESLRYSCDIPGQALGYKMGMMKIRALRDKTEKALEKKYDIRKFHAAVLGSGSMPMTVLEKHIDGFIESSE
jgi:uncharacterized protein (DUF885 family)